MTVQELINILSELPKDKKVYTDNIRVNLRGEIVLTHEDIHEEEQKREEEIARRDRERQEEIERGRDMPTFASRW